MKENFENINVKKDAPIEMAPTTVNKNQDIKEYIVDKYIISIKSRHIIDYNFESDPDQNEFRKTIKDMLKDMANSPELSISSDKGQRLYGQDFDIARKKLWGMSNGLYEEDKGYIIDSLNQNTYHRWDNVGGIINTIRDNCDDLEVDKVKLNKLKETFSELEQKKNIEKKTGITDDLNKELDSLILDILNILK